jgi:hydrogenase maturation protein HypF
LPYLVGIRHARTRQSSGKYVPGRRFVTNPETRNIVVTGRVQGVGYRPFVYVTARELGIEGSVRNGSGKVYIHAQGSSDQLDQLERALVHSAPAFAKPLLASSQAGKWQSADGFIIAASESSGDAEIHLPPDLYTCNDCINELTNPAERRYQYPFINCTQCGPRYTIVTAMPYDRPNTSMVGFPLCEQCRKEYESPSDRRFHAQPLACQKCGPELEFVSQDPSGFVTRADKSSALSAAIEALRCGQILAIKGVGGYHLVCDAANDEAVKRLRERKRRPDKPLAVMFPVQGVDGLDAVRSAVQLDPVTADAILHPARPIVLSLSRQESPLSPSLAPGLSELGVFLPYSPLHHQLLMQFERAVVATSGNFTGEPVIIDNDEADRRLAGIADAFLHHNRPIVRPADDAVVRPMASHSSVIRLGRGIAPLEHSLPQGLDIPTLAVGGHMKVTVALAWNDRLIVSPHIGDLDSPRSLAVFTSVIRDLQELYGVNAEQIVCDLHPGYASSRWAEQQDLPVVRVQHHQAHASALAAEHEDIDPWLVFAWDGTGYGQDGSLWGGEALAGNPGDWTRVASFRPFRLVGGDKAGREPWRSAAALMWEQGEPWQPGIAGMDIARQAWERDIGVWPSSAVGRLFDAASSLVLGRHQASYEGQGPMELESIAQGSGDEISLPLAIDDQGVLRSDWSPLLPMLCNDSISKSERAQQFHASMAQALVDQAKWIHQQRPFQAVGLSGGVFQNRRLAELVMDKLHGAGFDCRLHSDIPANDGGLSFGQIREALARQVKEAS